MIRPTPHLEREDAPISRQKLYCQAKSNYGHQELRSKDDVFGDSHAVQPFMCL